MKRNLIIFTLSFHPRMYLYLYHKISNYRNHCSRCILILSLLCNTISGSLQNLTNTIVTVACHSGSWWSFKNCRVSSLFRERCKLIANLLIIQQRERIIILPDKRHSPRASRSRVQQSSKSNSPHARRACIFNNNANELPRRWWRTTATLNE